jgi:hypothetical protein
VIATGGDLRTFPWKTSLSVPLSLDGRTGWIATEEPFGVNYKSAEKHCCLIFYERKILFRLKKQAE